MVQGLARLDEMISSLENQLGLSHGAPIEDLPWYKNQYQQSQEKKDQVEPKPNAEKTEKKKKKEKKPKAAAPATADIDQPEITKLDIRVGVIRKVWKHEKADKLYCEEIDVGEDTGPRQIASGLVPHYTQDEMQNMRCLVLCNLKARSLVGFKSHGMVLCAAISTEDGKEKVKFVNPPVDAKIGERIVFESLTGEPISAAQVEKKKVLQKLGNVSLMALMDHM